jgi:DNA repair protein RecN (Recombination protein N)
VAALDAALNALSDAQSAVEAALRAADFNPRELEESEERLFALRGAARKYNVPVESLSELASRMVTDLADLDAGEERLHALETQVTEAQAAFLHAAKDVVRAAPFNRCGIGRGGHGRIAGTQARACGVSGRDHKRH